MEKLASTVGGVKLQQGKQVKEQSLSLAQVCKQNKEMY